MINYNSLSSTLAFKNVHSHVAIIPHYYYYKISIFKTHITNSFKCNSISSTLAFNNVHSHVTILPHTIIYKISIFSIHITNNFNCNSLSSTLAFNNAHSHVAILPHSMPYGVSFATSGANASMCTNAGWTVYKSWLDCRGRQNHLLARVSCLFSVFRVIVFCDWFSCLCRDASQRSVQRSQERVPCLLTPTTQLQHKLATKGSKLWTSRYSGVSSPCNNQAEERRRELKFL
jgi:hypothetical protein